MPFREVDSLSHQRFQRTQRPTTIPRPDPSNLFGEAENTI
jgi:hypothetical protein